MRKRRLLSVLVSVTVLLATPVAHAATARKSYTERELRGLGVYFYGLKNPEAQCAMTNDSNQEAPSGSKIYMMGDSITEGAKTYLQTDLTNAGFTVTKINGVVSRSITSKGKGTTNGYEAIAGDANEITSSDIVVLALGTNGSDDGSGSGFKTQGENLIQKVKDTNKSLKKIYWVNLFSPAIAPRDQAYNAVINGFSAQDVTPIDMTKAGIAMSADKLHPSADGYKTYSKTLTAALSGSGSAAAIKSTGCGASDTQLNGDTNAAKIWDYLRRNGLSAVQAAGFMGNLQAEAHFEPRLVQYGKKNPDTDQLSRVGEASSLSNSIRVDGETGYGIAQWTSAGRQQALKDFASSKNTIAGDLATQLDFLWVELTGTLQKSVLGPLQATQDVRSATNVVLRSFECPRACVDVKERPTPENQAKYDAVLTTRTNFAQAILAEYGSNEIIEGGH